jgi:hypothetical protein
VQKGKALFGQHEAAAATRLRIRMTYLRSVSASQWRIYVVRQHQNDVFTQCVSIRMTYLRSASASEWRIYVVRQHQNDVSTQCVSRRNLQRQQRKTFTPRFSREEKKKGCLFTNTWGPGDITGQDLLLCVGHVSKENGAAYYKRTDTTCHIHLQSKDVDTASLLHLYLHRTATEL